MLIYTQAKSVDVFYSSVVAGSVTPSSYMTLNASDDANVIIAALFHIPYVTEWECSERAAEVGQIAWHASLCQQTREEEEEKEKKKKKISGREKQGCCRVCSFVCTSARVKHVSGDPDARARAGATEESTGYLPTDMSASVSLK